MQGGSFSAGGLFFTGDLFSVRGESGAERVVSAWPAGDAALQPAESESEGVASGDWALERCALLFGCEGSGLSPELLAAANVRVTVLLYYFSNILVVVVMALASPRSSSPLPTSEYYFISRSNQSRTSSSKPSTRVLHRQPVSIPESLKPPFPFSFTPPLTPCSHPPARPFACAAARDGGVAQRAPPFTLQSTTSSAPSVHTSIHTLIPRAHSQVPQRGMVESLNVATCAAIVLSEVRASE